MLGRQKMSQQDYAAAEAAFREAIRLQPENEIGQLALVAALLPQGKLADAIDVLGKVPRRGRLATPVHRLYGDIYAAQEMHGDAIRSYRAALLHSENGKQLIEEVEKSLPPGADQKAETAAYQAACIQLREQLRERNKQRAQAGEARGLGRRRRAAMGAGVDRHSGP
jgi:tetratricopeptide (TPR) repeat protein